MQGVISQRQSLVAALRKLLPEDCVIDDERGLRPFECDGLSAYRSLPMVVVLPRDTQEVSRVLALCHERGVKIVPRGAGTGLSGGALPLADGVTVGFGKLNRVSSTSIPPTAAPWFSLGSPISPSAQR